MQQQLRLVRVAALLFSLLSVLLLACTPAAHADKTDANFVLGELGDVADVGALAFSPDGRCLASDGAVTEKGNAIDVWDVSSMKKSREIKGKNGWGITRIAYSPDGRHIAASEVHGVIRIWTSAGEPVNRFRIFANGGASDEHLSFLDNAHVYLMIHQSMGAKWNIHNNRASYYVLGYGSPLNGATVDRSARFCAICTRTDVHIFTDEDWTRASADIRLPLDHEIRGVALSDDGLRVMGVAKEGKLYLIDVKDRKIVKEWQGHDNSIWVVLALPKNRGFVTAGADGVVKVWDSAGKLLADLERRYDTDVEALAVSPDGAILATAGRRQQIVLWDLKTLLKEKD
jgi:WD40 repeat protein